jgi:hypothetical protein
MTALFVEATQRGKLAPWRAPGTPPNRLDFQMAKRKPKGMTYPHRIETDQGNTVVKLIPSRHASKQHLCPSCDTFTDFYEQHVLLLPTRFPGNRRYMHQACYEHLRKLGISIILHPNLDYITPKYH